METLGNFWTLQVLMCGDKKQYFVTHGRVPPVAEFHGQLEMWQGLRTGPICAKWKYLPTIS